ncbi:MAG TPA: hypothetical protein VHV79_13130 [Mycobacteriales bacterium]|nr:hypothetical protein [Mycobacteriales bacterium]
MARVVFRLGLGVLLAGSLAMVGETAAGGAPRSPAAVVGGPGHWTKISTGTIDIGDVPSLFRTSNHVLHVAYPKGAGTATQIGTTAINPSGATGAQTDILSGGWSVINATPIVMAGPSGGLRVVFGGQHDLGTGFYDDGRMYTATSTAAGTTWAISSVAVGDSHSAYGSYGTGGVALADATPVAGFPLNSDFTWHVGTNDLPADSVYTQSGATMYDSAMVRSGNTVWVAWFSFGNAAGNTGVFVKRIYPTVGPTLKAPGSSHGTNTLETGRVALAARAGGGIYAAYCSGYPYCGAVRLWKVGTSHSIDVPGSKYAAKIALSAAPSGRLWLAWGDNIPVVHAVRTNRAATKLGIVRNVGQPAGQPAIYSLAIDGGIGKADVVINGGSGIWHTQVLPALKLRASPAKWHHGKSKKVTFKVSDAGDAVSGSVVRIGSKHCSTNARGVCTVRFPARYSRGKHIVTAKKSGYATARGKLKVS